MLTALTLDDVIATELRTAGSAIEVEFWRGFMQSDRCRLGWCDAIPNPEDNKDVYSSWYRTLAWSHEQGCSTLSTEAPLEQCIDAGESGGVAILTER